MFTSNLRQRAVPVLAILAIAIICGSVTAQTVAQAPAASRPATQPDAPKEGDKERAVSALTVTLKTLTNVVRPNGRLKVYLSVVNSSKTPQSFEVMNCSWYEHWESNSPHISLERWGCKENGPEPVDLKPGESYERSLWTSVRDGKPSEKISFKMGFKPIGSKQTYWSNEVAIALEGEESSRQEVAKVQGTWAAASIERGGKPVPEDEVKKLDLQMTFKGNEFMLMPLASKGPEHFPSGTFNLYTTSTPAAIDLITKPLLGGGGADNVILGIYELDGEHLKWVQAPADKERPTDFKAAAAAGLEVITFKRIKP